MKTDFTDDQKEIIREWAHQLDNAFRNLIYLRDRLNKEARLRERLKNVHNGSIETVESVIVSMNQVCPKPKDLEEVQNG
jgi:hypothetical protein